MDLSKYVRNDDGKNVRSFSIPLPRDVEAELKRLRNEDRLEVRAWARDLILENLPQLQALAKRKRAS